MMKVTIELENKVDAKICLIADDLIDCLCDIKEKLRSCYKYGDYKFEETHNVVEELFEHFYDAMSSRGINLDELIE